jgi:UDPglucose 6-dehydrogenase
MNVAVVGLWHLGSVTAACLAAAGFSVTAYDEPSAVAPFRKGHPPVFEPGLVEMIRSGMASQKLRFTDAMKDIASCELVWITYDTPVDDDDKADVDVVMQSVVGLFPELDPHATVLVSSQMPTGSVARLEQAYRERVPRGRATFACSPENLQLGRALDAFTKPERVVVGIRDGATRAPIERLFAPFTTHIEWMNVESAEMAKHAINAFLATSVAFANELAGLCERVGADARDVERALKSERRIGPRAYVRPGAAFDGGTLARDIEFIESLGARLGRPTPLFSGVRASNDAHKAWAQTTLTEAIGRPEGKRVAVVGLAYKAGTDTLRRSSALALCRWLTSQGARAAAFDPGITASALGDDRIELCVSIENALRGAAAVVITNDRPELISVDATSVVEWLLKPATVLDPSGFVERTLGHDPRIRYMTVGRPQ